MKILLRQLLGSRALPFISTLYGANKVDRATSVLGVPIMRAGKNAQGTEGLETGNGSYACSSALS
jgi:hypothetical protein